MRKLVVAIIFLLIFISACSNGKVEAYIEVGEEALSEERYEDAVHAFSLALKEDPEHRNAKQLLEDAKAKLADTIKDSDSETPSNEEKSVSEDEIEPLVRNENGEILNEQFFVQLKDGRYQMNDLLTLGTSIEEFTKLLGDAYYQEENPSENEGTYTWYLTSYDEFGAQMHVYFDLVTKEVNQLSFHTENKEGFTELGEPYFIDLIYDTTYYFNEEEVLTIMRNSYSEELGVVLKYPDDQFYQTVNTDYSKISLGLTIDQFADEFNQKSQQNYNRFIENLKASGQSFDGNLFQVNKNNTERHGGYYKSVISKDTEMAMKIYPEGTIQYIIIRSEINPNGMNDFANASESEQEQIMQENLEAAINTTLSQQSLIQLTSPNVDPEVIFSTFVDGMMSGESVRTYREGDISYYDFSDSEHTYFVVAYSGDDIGELYQEIRRILDLW